MSTSDFKKLVQAVETCRLCPRLVDFREQAPKRAAFKNQTYWRKPVTGFGDPQAWMLIIGLAPSAHGGNRTGRIFTGDESAKFLFQALYQASLANKASSEFRNDGLQLKGCYLTAALKCVPPQNKPTQKEFQTCSGYLEHEFFLLKNLTAVLALGKLAFDSYQRFLKKNQVLDRFEAFSHGKKTHVKGWPPLFGAYHPSPQNTYTGKLTFASFSSLLKKIQKECMP